MRFARFLPVDFTRADHHAPCCQAGPILPARQQFRHINLQITTVFVPAMTSLVHLEAADLHTCEIVFQVVAEELLNGTLQTPLVAFHRQNVVALASHDLRGDLLLRGYPERKGLFSGCHGHGLLNSYGRATSRIASQWAWHRPPGRRPATVDWLGRRERIRRPQLP